MSLGCKTTRWRRPNGHTEGFQTLVQNVEYYLQYTVAKEKEIQGTE